MKQHALDCKGAAVPLTAPVPDPTRGVPTAPVHELLTNDAIDDGSVDWVRV